MYFINVKLFKLSATFVSRENGIQSKDELFIGLHLDISTQLMATARTSEDIGTERSLQADQANVVKASGCDGLASDFLATNAQERLLHFRHKFLNFRYAQNPIIKQ